MAPGAAQARRAEIKASLENVRLPGNESMGVVGTGYLIEVAPGVFAGPAVYGALTGQRGGFFAVGGEFAWRQPLASRLALEAGFYGGGGGGGAAQVGGGLMIRPHADLMWDFGEYRAGVSASRVRFVNGGISSSQLGLVFSADSEFTWLPPALAGQAVDYLPHSGAGFDRVIITAGNYKPRPGSVNGANPAHIGFAGARFEQFFTPHGYRGIEAVGAASGGVAGYAEFLGALGFEAPVLSGHAALGARLAAGMGGGGAVATGGGALIKAAGYGSVATSEFTHLAVEGGYAWAPNGAFRAPYVSANLQWDLDHPYASSESATVTENEWVMGTAHVVGAARKDGSRGNLDAVVIRLNRYVTESAYLTGQAYSAYRGNAGAYSAGLVGVGYRIPLSADNGLYAGFEFLGGAAGGGGVATGSGAVIQPVAYAGVKISPSLGIRLDAARLKATGGALNSNLIGLAVDFDFGTATR